MANQPALKSIRIHNLLSFDEQGDVLQLGPLNVLIGPNGSGKSNLIEAISLLQSAPKEFPKPVREGGGIGNWLWKGEKGVLTATIEVLIDYPRGDMPIRYKISFTEVGQRLDVTDERIENEKPFQGYDKPYFYFGYENGRPMINLTGSARDLEGGTDRIIRRIRNVLDIQEDFRQLRREDIDPQQSVLSQRRDPDLYPELTYVGRLFESFRLYREWSFGRVTPPRRPQPADLRNDFLEEDTSNLGLVLNRLRKDIEFRNDLLKYLKLFYEDAEDIDVIVEGGTVQVFLVEKKFTTPATRLSDGTLRWLCLLAILLHPSPPPLVCLEEPELGLHPDIIPTLADLIREASGRMQLIVTTHSNTFVDALSEVPEAIIVCEKEDGATRLKRLSRDELSVWLKNYSLGELWSSGEIGGNRW